MEINGWSLYGHAIFIHDVQALLTDVERRFAADPHAAMASQSYALLRCVMTSIRVRVPGNPGHRDFLLGNTLGRGNGHWRRVKKGMPNRYRLFFQYQSKAPKSITYAWFNDETTLRKAGARTDCYTVFRAHIAAGRIPNDYKQLVAASVELQEGFQLPGGG